MKKTLLLILILLVCCLGGLSQKINKSNSDDAALKKLTSHPSWEKVAFKYDKFKDKTQIHMTTLVSGAPLKGLLMVLSTAFDGKTAPKDVKVLISFISFNESKLYNDERSFIILWDDKRITPFELKYDDSERAKLNYVETIIYAFPIEYLKKIGEAKSVEMQLKNTEFVLKEKQLSLIREFYKQLFLNP